MAIIFDSFSDKAQAEKFARVLRKQFSVKAFVYTDLQQASVDALFPYQLLGAAAVLASRSSFTAENEMRDLVESFGGSCAGT